MELILVSRKMAAYFRLGSKRAAALRPFLALFLAVALAVILQNLVFAAHTETTAISPANVTFVKNSTLRAFDFNVSWTGGADNITAINISLPSGFLLGSFGNLSGAGFFCSNVSALLVNCSNSSAYGLNPAAPSVIIQINATPQVATGTYNWVINTTDTAAAINGSVVTTSVDSEAPTVAAPTLNVSSPTRLNTNFFINASFNDTSPASVNGSGVVACSYNVTNSTGGLVVSAPMNYSTGVVGVANATIQSILPEGNNSVFVNCTDNATFTGYSLATVLTVDLTPPSISVQSPANATYASAAIPLNFTAGDLNGVGSCRSELTNSSGLPVNYSLSNCGNVSSMSGVTEGSNSVRVWANDSAGNWNSSTPVFFSVDTGYPSVIINSPANQSWQTGTISLNYSATDAKTIDACSWRWKNSTGVWSGYTSLTCGSGLAFNFNTANCGDNATAACAVEVRANDTANNVNSTEVYLKVDNTVPSVDVTQPSSGWFNGTVLVRITVNDSTSGASSVIFYNGSAWASAVLESGNSYNGVWNGTINTAAFSDGTSILISANTTDLAGNNGSDASVPTIQVDNNPPTIVTPTLNVSGPTNRNTNIFVNSTFNDTGGQGLAADTCQLYVTGATAVSAYAINNSAGTSGAVNGTISAALNDGTNNIYLNCTDQQGWTRSNFTSLLVDTVPPGIAIQSPVAKNYSTALIPLNFTAGDLNGVGSCRSELTNSSGLPVNYSIASCQNTTLSGVTDGFNSVRVWANDSAGNWNVSASVSFTVDTIFPACSAFSANVSYARNGESVNFTATCNDTGTNISRVFFNLTAVNSSVGVVQASPAGGNSYYYAASVSASDGPKTLPIFNVSDNAGNVNSSLVPAASVIVDNTNPSVTNVTFNVSAVRTGASVNVSATVNDTNLNASRLFVYNSTGGATLMTLQGGYLYTAFVTITETGNDPSLRYNISAYDNASNVNASMYVAFNLDNTAPVVAESSPANDSWTNDNTTSFQFNVTDNLAAYTNCTIFVDSAGKGSNSSVANNTPTTIVSTELLEGARSWQVNCSDAAGNLNQSGVRVLNVDVSNPASAITFPSALSWTSNATPLINFTLTDNLDPVLNYTVFVDGSAAGNGTVNNNTLTSYTLPSQTDNQHVVNVEALDEAGNRINSSSITIVVDTLNPSVSGAAVNVSAAKTGDSINVSAVINDTNLNVSRLFVYNSTGAATLMLPQGGNVYTALITVTETGDNPSLQYNISAYDNASNVNASMYVAFNLDNTAPAVYAPSFNASSPTRFNANLFINASFNDTAISGVNGSGVSKCSYNVTNSTGAVVPWTLMNSSGGVVGVANATITATLPDGANSIYVNCSDAVGWVGYSSASTLVVDTVAPSWNQTPSSKTVEYGAAFYYQINASDLYLNKYSISDTANFTINAATGVIQNNTFLPVGAHPLTTYVNDTAGNLNSSSFTITVSDSTFPVVSNITATPSTGTAGISISINATISDVPPLVVKAKVQYVNKTNYAVIDYALLNMSGSGSNYNATWNTAGAYNGTYVVDINATDSGGNTVIVNDGASIALGFGAQSAYSNSSVSTDSLNQTTITSANVTLQVQANNSRQNESVTIVKYSGDPSGSSLQNNFGATEIGAFTDIVSSISGSNLTWALIKIYYSDSQLGTMPEGKLGVYYWNGNSWDRLKSGMGWVYGVGVNTTGNYVWANVSHLSLFSAAGDENGPQASIIPFANPTYANVTFTALIDDVSLGGSDISAAEYYIGSDPGRGNGSAIYPQDGLGFDGNKSETVNGTINVDALSNGAHTIYVRGMDAASNWGDTTYYTFTVNKTAPTLNSIIINGNATYATSTSAILTLSASGAYECSFSNDASNYSAWDSYAATAPWTLSSGDGTKTVYYKCKNSAGLEASAISDSIILDTAAPSINITAPAAGATANGNYSINFSISDANGVSPQNVSISFDGAEWIATSSNFSYWWNTTVLQDGSHNIQIRAIDSAGNTGESLVRLAYVNNKDQVAPALSAITNGSVSDSSALIYWNTSEPADAQVEYGTVSGSYIQSGLYAQNSTNHSVLLSRLQMGTLYFYRVKSRDASGNLNVSSEYNFTTSSVDTTAPVVNITAPAAGSAVNGVVSVNYTISDGGGVNASNVSISFDGPGWIATGSNFSYSWNTSLFLDGSHSIKVRAVDSSGNAGESEIFVFVNNLDRIAPAIFNVSASANLTTALIAWNTSEPADAQVEFGVASGSYGPSGLYSHNSTNHTVLLSGLSPGTLYFYRVKSKDASGNPNVSGEFNFTTLVGDVVAPAISSVANGTVTDSYAIITWSTDENASSQVEYGLSVSYGFATGELDLSPRVLFHSVNLTTGLSPGTLYHYRVLSKDASGNLNISGDYNFTTSSVDTTAPVINITAPAAGSMVSNLVLVEYTISDSGGVNGSNVSISFDGGGWIVTNSNFSYSWDTFFFADGYSHTVKIRAVDSSGNIGYSELLSVIVRDQVAPGIYAVSNSTTSTTATISWNTTEPADAQVEYGTFSGSYTPSGLYADNSITHSVLISPLSPGTRYFYRVKSKDASNNLNTSEVFSFTTVFVDVTAPVVNITAPAAGSAVNGVVQINYSISDSGGVDGSNVSISFDGPNWTVTGSNSTYAWNTSLFADGYHILQVRAFDSSANLGSSGVLGVYVNNADRDAPGIFAVSNATTSDSVTISWNTTENADAWVEYGLSSGSYSWVTGTYADNSTNHSVLISGLSSGTRYFYKVKSRDNSGNPNASQEFSFTTVYNDSSAPSVAIVSPRGGDYIGLSKAIVVNVSDGSGIDDATIKLYKDGAIFHTYSPSECTGAGTTASPFVCTWLWNTADEDNGDHTLQLYASDLAGNSRESMLLLVKVDRVNPILPSSTAPSNNQYLYVSEPTVNFTVERGSQGLVNKSSISVAVDGQPAMDFSPASNCSLTNGTNDYFCSFRITRYTHTQLGYVFNGSLMLGNHSIIISASDLAGNNATPRSVNFTLLDVNDTISVTSLTMDKSTAVANGADYWQYTFGVTLGYSAGTRVSFKLADWSDGYNHSIPSSYANLTSGSSQISIASSYVYSLPVSDSDASTPGVQASLVLRQYIPVGTVTSQYSTSYGMKTMDLESPYLYSTSPANGSFLNYAIQNVTATFADPGGSGVYLDGSAVSLSNASAYVPGAKLKYPPNGLVWNLSGPLPDGNYTIGAVPRDRYGNTGSAYYAYFVLDRIPPTAATMGPLPASGYTTNLLVPLNWSGAADDRSGVSHYQIWRSANSGPFVNIANTSAAAYNDSGVQNNFSYTYDLSTVDRAGNVQFSSVLRSTTIDITPPLAPVLNPLTTPTKEPAVTVSGTAEPNSTVRVYLNGEFKSAKVATAGTFTSDLFTLPEGNNTINATATDPAGLPSGSSNMLSVLLDTIAPAIGSLSPANSSNVSSAAPEISAVFNESGSGINSSSIIVLLDGAPVSPSYDSLAKKVSYVPAPLSEGAHNVSLWVTDLVANPTSFVQWSFGVDLTPPPQISGLGVIQDTSTTMNLSWSASTAPDLAYYRVYRGQSSFSNVSSASLVNGSVTSTAYRDSLLNSSTAYYYAVTAVDAVGNENSTVVSRYNTTLS